MKHHVYLYSVNFLVSSSHDVSMRLFSILNSMLKVNACSVGRKYCSLNKKKTRYPHRAEKVFVKRNILFSKLKRIQFYEK